jgi:hypothetical protein
MSTNADFDRHAAAFLADGPTELADRVLDAALREVHQTRQRRRWAVPWRLFDMRSAPRFAAAGIATVLALGGVAYLIGLRQPIGPAAVATPTSSPAASLDTCWHELVETLFLDKGCEYRVFTTPPLFVISDGTWLDSFQTASALDFVAIIGPAQSTTVYLRVMHSLPPDPCQSGSAAQQSPPPASARDYVDWLGRFISEPTRAVEVDALGLSGWQFDLATNGNASFDPEDPCAFVSLFEPAVIPPDGLAPAGLVVERTARIRVYALDTTEGVLLAVLRMTDAAESQAAGERFLAGIQARPG